LLVSRAGRWRREGFELWAADNGAWADYQAGAAFDEAQYGEFLRWIATQAPLPRFIVLPDVVGCAAATLDLAARYRERCQALAPLVLVAAQDGVSERALARIVSARVGIFLGGTTAWKLENMVRWGRFAAARGVWFHVGRVNTWKRCALAQAAGADSVDGSSVTRYLTTLPLIDNGLRQRDLYMPSRRALQLALL
jgi:hypothetical protein